MGRKTMDALGVLGLYTETPLHCGAESATGYVDLPIQRERHTEYPVIPGSTLKGVLKDDMGGEGRLSQDEIRSYFGADSGAGEDPSPGKVSFGDGLLLAFPIRSSGAPFHWVTSPFVLERLARALSVESVGVEPPPEGTAWAADGKGDVLLEELRLDKKEHPSFFGAGPGTGLSRLLSLLPGESQGFAHTRSILPQRLLIVSDQDFKELVEVGTEVLTRIKLNSLGTTQTFKEKDAEELGIQDRQGNLFVEEVVPPETLFFCALRAVKAESARFVEVLQTLQLTRVGGDETIGRGLTHTTWLDRTREG